MRLCGRPLSSLALIAALLLALGVAACGRKGSLDPPPAASAAGQQNAPAEGDNKSIAGTLGATASSRRTRELPPPPSPKRDLPIDFLLN